MTTKNVRVTRLLQDLNTEEKLVLDQERLIAELAKNKALLVKAGDGKTPFSVRQINQLN